MFVSRTLQLRGSSHDDSGKPCQDAAFAVDGPRWHVLVVSDGVGSTPHSEVGAQLISRLAARAALKYLEAGHPPTYVGPAIREDIEPVLQTLVASLGAAEAKNLLFATLVLCCASEDEVVVWRAGDGEAGLIGFGPDVEAYAGRSDKLDLSGTDEQRVVGDDLSLIVRPDGLRSLVWRAFADPRKKEKVRDLPLHWLTEGKDLALVFHARKFAEPYHGVYVATDGLVPVVRSELARRPVAKNEEIKELATARVGVSVGGDDLAVAWGGSGYRQVLRDLQGRGDA
jgi:serine/threonine protein phosphatase PrpC